MAHGELLDEYFSEYFGIRIGWRMSGMDAGDQAIAGVFVYVEGTNS